MEHDSFRNGSSVRMRSDFHGTMPSDRSVHRQMSPQAEGSSAYIPVDGPNAPLANKNATLNQIGRLLAPPLVRSYSGSTADQPSYPAHTSQIVNVDYVRLPRAKANQQMAYMRMQNAKMALDFAREAFESNETRYKNAFDEMKDKKMSLGPYAKEVVEAGHGRFKTEVGLEIARATLEDAQVEYADANSEHDKWSKITQSVMAERRLLERLNTMPDNYIREVHAWLQRKEKQQQGNDINETIKSTASGTNGIYVRQKEMEKRAEDILQTAGQTNGFSAMLDTGFTVKSEVDNGFDWHMAYPLRQSHG